MQQGRTRRKYIRKQNTRSQIYEKETVKQEEHTPKNSSNLEIQTKKYVKVQNFDDISFQKTFKSYKFAYRFNEYVRMSLIKLLPPKCKDITINRKQQTIKGPPNQCQNLIKKIKSELQIYVMKMIKVQSELDIDQIEFHLNPDYQVKVYRLKYVQLSANDMSNRYNFNDQAQNLIIKMKSQNQILIRIRKEYSEQCVNDISELVKKENKFTNRYQRQTQISQQNLSRISFNNPVPIINNSSSALNNTGLTKTDYNSSGSDSLQEDDQEDQPSFYQIADLKAKQQSRAKEQKPKVKNKSCVNLIGNLSQPYDDDSVSVAGKKKNFSNANELDRNMKKKEQNVNQTFNKPKKVQKHTVQLKKYEFQGQNFDETGFLRWLKENKNLERDQVIIDKQKDPYDDNLVQYTISLVVDQNIPMDQKGKKQEAIDLYFKYKKVIFFKLKNEAYKSQLIKDQVCQEDIVKVQYIKGYKSPKWPENTMWRHIIKKDYTNDKRSANTEFFQLFFIQGIKDIVLETEARIRDKIQKEPKQDVSQQIIFTVNEIADQIRDNDRIKHLIKRHVEYIIKEFFKYVCSINEITFILAGIKINVLVKFQQHSNFLKSLKSDITNKLKTQLKIQSYDCNFIIDRLTYQKLQKQIVILQKKEKSFVFLSSNVEMGNAYNIINSIINNINKISQKQIQIQDYLLGKRVKQKIIQLQQQSQFSQVKFNDTLTNKKVHIFKFYARGYLLDRIEEEINCFKHQQMKNRLSYHQIFKPRVKQLLEDQELIEKIHQKYNIYMTPTQDFLQCRINVVGQTSNFKTKILQIKNTKSLDYAPLNSIIIFRSLHEIQNFESSWSNICKNYFKKHGHSTPFKQKSRNYTVILKQNQSSADMLRQTLDANQAITQISLIMPQYDKKQFIFQIIRTLIQQKKYEGRQISLFFLEADTKTNFEVMLGIQPYNPNNKNKKKEQKIVKYYISDGTNLFYYSKSGNQKIIQALNYNHKSVILNNQDLNITHNSHKFFLKANHIVHLQSSKAFPVQIIGNKVTFTLNNKIYQMPTAQAFKVLQCVNLNMAETDLSLGVYQIKFDTMQQINMFSGFVRKVLKEENVVKVDKIVEQIQVQYNFKVGKVVYEYSSEENSSQNLGKVIKQINDFVTSKVKTKQFSLKQMPNLSKEDIQKLKSQIEQDQSITCNYSETDQSFTVKTYDDNQFHKIQWKLRLFENNLQITKNLKEEVKYPAFWQPQKQPIQQFIVPANTTEFKNVQALFKVGTIKCLIRIQNQIIYKKYYEEGQFLKDLNDGTPVKTMQLFHGTRSTNPQEIYKDKEESFNINYSSDSNFLGRGIYFAEKSEYSNDYRYTQVINNPAKLMGIFGSDKVNTYSMFLCEVYVGQSQKCLKHNGAIKDTSYRDAAKKVRYQSMTDFLNNSNVYVVYKSRRAYPLYLIKY